MDILGQSAALVGATSFALGLSVAIRNPRNTLYLSFTALVLVIGCWGLFFFLDRVQSGWVWYELHLFANVWLGPFALHFIQTLNRIRRSASDRLRQSAIILALGLTVALIFGWEQDHDWVRTLVLFSPTTVVLQILQLMWIDRRIRKGAAATPKVPTVGLVSRKLIYSGALLVLLISTMDHVSWLGRVVPALGNLGLCVYLYFLSQAITQQRLMNFSALVSRFIVLVAMAASVSLVYVFLVGWVENNPTLFLLNTFIASFAILMLLEPLRWIVAYFTQRLLTREHRLLNQLVRESIGGLAMHTDPAALYQSIMGLVELTLNPGYAALFVLDFDGTRQRRVRSTGDSAHPVREVLAGNPLLEHCRQLKARGALPVLLDQILESEAERAAGRRAKEVILGVLEGLRALDCNLLIPLQDDERVLGFVIIRVPSPPEPWGGNWGLLSIIYPYFEQAARALRGMEVFVRSRERDRLATLGTMAAGLAHEIRNPLGAIKGAAQFLDPTEDRPESRFLRIIIEETDRLNRVVTQFLDYSKPGAGAMSTTALGPLARKTTELLAPTLPEGVVLEFREPDGREPRANVSPEQIRQVLINLIQNAANAVSGRAEAKIRVEVSESEQDAVISVEDNGPGIRRENLEKIFIPFFTTTAGGTGLGLSICQRIVEAHRGRIEVATEEGRYTRFSVILPKPVDNAAERDVNREWNEPEHRRHR